MSLWQSFVSLFRRKRRPSPRGPARSGQRANRRQASHKGPVRKTAAPARPVATVRRKQTAAPADSRPKKDDTNQREELRIFGRDICRRINEVRSEVEEAQDAKFVKALYRNLVEHEFEIPLFPMVSLQLMRITADPFVAIEKVSSVIETDQVIAAKVIGIANSPLYRTAAETKSIRQAVMKLGLREVTNVVMAVSMYSKIFRIELFQEQVDLIREHAIGCAYAAKHFAPFFRVEPDEAFLGGLMHDVGKMVVYKVIAEIQLSGPKDYRPSEGLLEVALQKFHPEIGGLMAMEWSLPATVSECLRRHHDISSADEEAKPLATTVFLANHVCHYLQIGVEGRHEEKLLAFRKAIECIDLGEDEEKVVAGVQAFKDSYEGIRSEIGS